MHLKFVNSNFSIINFLNIRQAIKIFKKIGAKEFTIDIYIYSNDVD